MPHDARRMWSLFEPLHAVTYFVPECRERFETAGLRGFWRGYFAGRSAPLGKVDAAPVTAAFFSFAAPMVERALPDVWTRATPEAVLQARQDGAVAALRRLLGEQPTLSEAADLLSEAASYVDTAGRVLAAANAALPVPSEPIAKLWHATTVLREHRGDGHVAALVSWELDGCEALVWRTSLDLSRDALQPARGWTDEQWAEAEQRLMARGWLDLEGRATALAAQAHRDIEAITDRLAFRPWEDLGPEATDRLVDLLTPLSQRAYAGLPISNPIGLPSPILE
ncbi:SCO6745 family protein [Catelliglobosispora koreensis]|uniref:SCO6745 family protein n=1 Tax=Catelliglobosispora koreensis TaxID=129052 RepID=UPI0003AB03F8